VVVVAVLASLAFTRVAGRRIRAQARHAEEHEDPDKLPEQ
jgi:hypothetical protein